MVPVIASMVPESKNENVCTVVIFVSFEGRGQIKIHEMNLKLLEHSNFGMTFVFAAMYFSIAALPTQPLLSH